MLVTAGARITRFVAGGMIEPVVTTPRTVYALVHGRNIG